MDDPSALLYFWTRTLLVSGLVGVAAILLVLGRSPVLRFTFRLLIAAAILSAFVAGVPRWIPNPTSDYMTPIAPFSILAIVAGLFIGVLCARRWRDSGLLVALTTCASATIVYALLTEMGVLTLEGRHGVGRGLYVLPVAIAGALLGWLMTYRQWDKAIYVVGWMAVGVAWWLSHYAAQVAALEDAQWYTTFQAGDPTLQGVRLAQIGLSQFVTNIVYVAGSLLLLLLPFVLKIRRETRPANSGQPGRAVTAGS